MGSERNPNYPCGVVVLTDGIEVYFPGYEYKPNLGKFTLEVMPHSNGHGEEIRYLLKNDSPVAVWEQSLGADTYEVSLFLGSHSKLEEGFCFFPILHCGFDEQIGEYTEAWLPLR